MCHIDSTSHLQPPDSWTGPSRCQSHGPRRVSVSVTKTGCYNRKLKVDYEEIKWNIYSEFIM